MTDFCALAVLDHWQRDLAIRVQRRRLVFDLIDTEVEIDDLATELEQLKRVVRCLRWLEKFEGADEKAEVAA